MKHNHNLLSGGKLDPLCMANALPAFVVLNEWPFTARTIAEHLTGGTLTVGQVYYRLRKLGISLRDLREGRGGKGQEILARYEITHIDSRLHSRIIKTVSPMYKKKKA